MGLSRTLPITLSASLEKPTKKTVSVFLKRLGNLLEDGFSLQDGLSFLEKLSPRDTVWIQCIQNELEKGRRLDEALSSVGFPETIVSRIYFASVHGNYAEVITSCGVTLEAEEKRRRKLQSLLSYPLLLMLFMTGLLLSMRTILLPHLQMTPSGTTNKWDWFSLVTSRFVQYFPYGLLIGLVGLASAFLVEAKRKQTRDPFLHAVHLCSRKLTGPLFKLYYSQLFSQEWGRLFDSSLELREIVRLMQEKAASRLMQETGARLEQELQKGQVFSETLATFPFLQQECVQIVHHGEMTGKLGKELLVYAEVCLSELEEKTEKIMTLIQPLAFLFIAFLIICVYGALLMPMLSNMEGML